MKITVDEIKTALIKNHYFLCERAYIRGSYADGTYSNSSDLDLLIVSNDFKGIDIIKRKDIVRNALIGGIDIEIDPLCLTCIEFERLLTSENIGYINEKMVGVIV